MFHLLNYHKPYLDGWDDTVFPDLGKQKSHENQNLHFPRRTKILVFYGKGLINSGDYVVIYYEPQQYKPDDLTYYFRSP